MAIRLLSYLSFFLLLTASSCDKELQELMMSKTPYNGNELRIDGYYYSDEVDASDYGVAVFYRDGVCYHLFGTDFTEPLDEYIEQEILLNSSFVDDLRTTPTHIGVFQIAGESIEFETWEAGRDITTFSHFGDIINDTAFILRERVNNDQGVTFEENITYRFKQFSPKPDSTTRFIE